MKNWLTYEAGHITNFQRWVPATLVAFDPAAVVYVIDAGYNFPNCENCCIINFINIADIQSALP